MNAMIAPEEREAALLRAVESLPPNASQNARLARLIITHENMRAAMEESRPPRFIPVWGSAGQVAIHFGVTRAAALRWIAPLIQAGRVRILTPPGGWTRYNIPDIEREFTPKTESGK